MRQIFSSQRLENVEGVARLLHEHGIETYVSGGRSYKGARRRPFSYRDGGGAEPQPAVWIVKAEDQTRARQLLREGGLLDTTRGDSYVPEQLRQPEPGATSPNRMAMRIKLVLLGLIGFFVMLVLVRLLGS